MAAALPGITRRSLHPDDAPAASPNPEGLYLLDTMGELGKAYSLCDVAIVGRTFNGWGGSDPIEPIALGKPTIVGPDTQNFRDVVDAFVKAGGLIQTAEPAKEVVRLLDAPEVAAAQAEKGRSAIRERQGASARHAEMLVKMMRNRGKTLE